MYMHIFLLYKYIIIYTSRTTRVDQLPVSDFHAQVNRSHTTHRRRRSSLSLFSSPIYGGNRLGVSWEHFIRELIESYYHKMHV